MKKQAFSLAEMMVVMLILTIVIAAAAPVVTKKTRAMSDEYLWRRIPAVGSEGKIQYGYNGSGNTYGIAVGTTTFANTETAKVLINTSSDDESHILFKQSDTETGRLKVNAQGDIIIGAANLPSTSANASNVRNMSIGNNATVSISGSTNYSQDNMAIGKGATISMSATGSNSTNNMAIGNNARILSTTGQACSYNTAIGVDAIIQSTTSGTYSGTAIGYNAQIDNFSQYAVAVGATARAHCHCTAIGSSAHTFVASSWTAWASTAIGYNAEARGDEAVAIGYGSATNGTDAIAIGTSSSATNTRAIAIGYTAAASANRSIALGGTASGAYSMAIGALGTTNTSATQNGSVAIGGYYDGTNYTGAQSTTANYIVLGTSSNTVVVPGTFSNPSDRRLKNIGSEYTDGLDKIREIKPYNYSLKKDKKNTPRVGALAQDVQKIFPNAVEKDSKGYFMLRQEDIFYAMVNSIQELEKMVKWITNEVKTLVSKVQRIDDKLMALVKVNQESNSKIQALEAKNKELEARLAKLEKRLHK